jgi:ABC-type uncharacterized transport system ATPase subunit
MTNEFDRPFGYARTMYSSEEIERFRNMTIDERLALTFQMTRQEWPKLFEGTKEEIQARFDELNRENDLGNENILKVLYGIDVKIADR